ncbi:hypothetical protein VCX22_20215 [Aeromonas caviae]|uniref:hypothetical protein n=1 Tax=Aeromonas caviae TaxID=648 RepID=UPI002B24A211|nr:hypothetical protein [Aeromonas caviae]MEA9419740.1 hypothetical protein [Aeromonas caviae]
MQQSAVRNRVISPASYLFAILTVATFACHKKQIRDINHTIYLTSLTPQKYGRNGRQRAPNENDGNKNAPHGGNADQLRIH